MNEPDWGAGSPALASRGFRPPRPLASPARSFPDPMRDRDFRPALAERIERIRQTLPPSVRLVAVTKQVSADRVRAAYDCGLRDFGESRVQEAEAKQEALADLPDITWHAIGHIQSNKARRAVELFQWIHSVDSLKLAQRLDRLAAEADRRPKVCLQVKLRPDPDKFGWTVPDLWRDLAALDRCESLEICGIMAIPPLGLSLEETQTLFDEARELAEKLRREPSQHLRFDELSLGMSGDYPQAIAAGATVVRLGRVLFGDRPQ